MIDWHAHILHNMDDGSKDIKESLALLKELVENAGYRVVKDRGDSLV